MLSKAVAEQVMGPSTGDDLPREEKPDDKVDYLRVPVSFWRTSVAVSTDALPRLSDDRN